MALLHVNFFSKVLGIACSMDVILPEVEQGIGVHTEANGILADADGTQKDADGILTDTDGNSTDPGGLSTQPPLLPVLYLLHGLSDDHTIWQRRTSIERYVAARRLAVVMPAVNRSFYTDQKHGYKYWMFISEELPQIVRTLFRISSRREDNFVAGLSMGGYGALKLGLRCPDRYAAAASLSGVTDLGRLVSDENPDRLAEGKMIFGSLDEYLGSDDDLFALAEKTARPGISKPKLFMACGTDDFLYQDNLAFKPHIEKLGYDLAWSEKPGAIHEWGYWDEMIQQVLDWLPLGDRRNG